MKYTNIKEGRFISRPGRFTARVDTGREIVTAHIKNTARCAELFLPDAKVYLEYKSNPARKTPCDLIAVEKRTSKGKTLVNVDSQSPNVIAKEWLAGGGLGECSELRAEYTIGQSRIDFYMRQPDCKTLVEVKGCTLEKDGHAFFPDAPTERGIKHLKELTRLRVQGWRCCVLFVIQMKGIHSFSPNRQMHPAFADALRDAKNTGVEIYAVDCKVSADEIAIDGLIPIIL